MFQRTVGLAKDLGFVVVAEDVETLEQEEFARGCDCDLLQGFRLSLPLEVEA